MKTKKITVIIPVYNAGKYLVTSLESLERQTMSQEDFEVIVIDDVSTDNSAEIAASFIGRIKNLRLVRRTENAGGPMIPRNQGIDLAEGEFILFQDNDDFLGDETLARFYEAATLNHSDVVIGKYVGVNGRRVPLSQFQKGNRLEASVLGDNLIYTLAPHKMFRSAFLKEHGFYFEPQAVVGEDQLFVMKCYIEAQVITVLADYDYYYVVSRGNENLSLKYFPASEFFYAFNQIMIYIKEHVSDEVYQNKLRVAFIKRFLHASRIKGMLFSKTLTREQLEDWFAETKKFFQTHFSDEASIKQVQSRYRYIVRIALDGSLDDLRDIHQVIHQSQAKDVAKVTQDNVYAKLTSPTTGRKWLLEVSHLTDMTSQLKRVKVRKAYKKTRKQLGKIKRKIIKPKPKKTVTEN